MQAGIFFIWINDLIILAKWDNNAKRLNMEINSIKEFRENFNKIYQEQVIPAIKNLDGERKKIYSSIDRISYKIYICLGILLGSYTILAIFVFHKLNIDIYIKILIAAVAIIEFIKFIRKKQFENKVK